MPNRYLIANWKMNVPPEGIDAVPRRGADAGDGDVVVAPPFVYLEGRRARDARRRRRAELRAIRNRARSPAKCRAAMLRDCGARVRHRRPLRAAQHLRRDDALVARKLALAIEAGLTPVLCIGEDQRVRDAGHAARSVSRPDPRRGRAAARDGGARSSSPTSRSGRSARDAMPPARWSRRRRRDPRRAASASGRRAARRAPMLYGGSVTPDNVDDLVAHGDDRRLSRRRREPRFEEVSGAGRCDEAAFARSA